MKKRFLSIALCAVLMLATPVFAGSASTEVGDYTVYVECTRDNSYHSVIAHGTATYPMGSGRIKCSSRGEEYFVEFGGTSTSSYWVHAQGATPGVTILLAETTGYGRTVTAFP